MILAFLLSVACVVTDGDTIRCGDERIRLLAIDAPEMGGNCRQGRVCVSGDPVKSKQTLEEALGDGVTGVEIERYGQDRYGRTLARVIVAGRDLSCHQIARGSAVYVEKWDKGRVVADACGL